MTKALPVLIIDKKGIIGSLVAQEISKKLLVVLVSKLVPEKESNIIHVPFSGTIPQIPDNTYSKILVIDDKSSVLKDSLESIVKKAREDGTELYFASFLGEDLKKVNGVLTSHDKSKVVLIGEIFDSRYTLEPNTPSSFIEQVRKDSRIELNGDGTDVSFPVALEDVVRGLSELIFKNIKENLICLFPKNPITHISLAHILQKQNPLIKIDFKKKRFSKNNFVSPLEGYFYLGDRSELQEQIKKLDLVAEKAPTRIEVVKTPYFFKRAFFGLLLSFLLIALLPLITTYSLSFLGAQEIMTVKDRLVKGDLVAAQESSRRAVKLLKIASYSSNLLLIQAKFIGQADRAERVKNQTESLYIVSQISDYLTDSSIKIDSAMNSASYSKEEFLAGVSSLKNAVTKYRELEARDGLPPSVRQQFLSYSPVIDLLDSSIDHFPGLLGLEGKRKYLILFLNNMELRPGGGFIGSYAVASIENAKVEHFNIYDVYDADGQLKEHLEPPFPIRRYLPSAHFYLRDSNFYLNFADNALSAQNFLRLEKNEEFDGVIAVDVSFTRYILEVLGEIPVANYDEKVNSENFFELADKYSRESFFPGSTQKKDFLGAVFRSMQNELGIRKVSYLDFIQAVAKGVSEKHIQVYSNDPSVQNTVLINGMSSDILDARSKNKSVINDYTGVVEANLGVNKVNKDVARTIRKSFEIQENGESSSTVTVSFKNNSKVDNYKNYIRFIAPLNSRLLEIKINGKEQRVTNAILDPGLYEARNFKPPVELEVQTENQSGKTVFGFLLTIPKDNIKIVSLTYALPGKIDIDTHFNYSLKYFKQPGTEDYPFGFQLNYPSKLKLINANTEVVDQDGKTNYELQLEKDFNLIIRLTPK